MTTKISTKHAFLTSIVAVILCFTMLLGTTYAWFTDSVTSSNNKIVAGTLAIDLELLDTEGNWNSIKNSNAPIFDYEKWEPGYTSVKILKVENEGNLALKWKATLIAENALSALATVIDVYVKPSETELAMPASRDLLAAEYTYAGTLADFVGDLETTTTGTLYNEGDVAYLGIALKMRETAGNEFQGMDLLGTFDICILATQLDFEADSIDKNYDVNSEFLTEIGSASSLVATLANGGNIQAADNIDASGKTLVAADNTVLDLAGNAISADYLTATGDVSISNGTLTMPEDGYIYTDASSNITLENVEIASDKLSVMAYNGGTIALKNVTLNNTATSNPIQNYGGNLILDNVTAAQAGDAATAWYSSAIQVVNTIAMNAETGKYQILSQANTTINSGSYTGKKAIQISAPGGNVTINGGTFVGSDYVLQGDFAPQNYMDGNNFESVVTINGGDFTGAIKVSAATQLVIKGGTFSVDPSAYLADGYVATESNGVWTVAAE